MKRDNDLQVGRGQGRTKAETMESCYAMIGVFLVGTFAGVVLALVMFTSLLR